MRSTLAGDAGTAKNFFASGANKGNASTVDFQKDSGQIYLCLEIKDGFSSIVLSKSSNSITSWAASLRKMYLDWDEHLFLFTWNGYNKLVWYFNIS